MVPARNLLRRQYNSYGGCFGDTNLDFHQEKPNLRPSPMAGEEDSRSPAGGGGGGDGEEDGGDQVGTSSSRGEAAREGWLQLSIGGGGGGSGSGANHSSTSSMAPIDICSGGGGRDRGGVMELELFSDRPPPPPEGHRPIARPLLPPPPLPEGLSYRPEITWGYWNSTNMAAATSYSSAFGVSPAMMQCGYRQFVYPPGSWGLPAAAAPGGESSSASSDMRVVRPPRRPHAGVWFMLQAAQNQAREPFLPQIPKSYLRIKDGRMTVKLLMKYLVKKLGLEDESEVEITCRGQQLLPFLSLQHVRDCIWSSREAAAVLPEAPAADHVMTLQYGRSA